MTAALRPHLLLALLLVLGACRGTEAVVAPLEAGTPVVVHTVVDGSAGEDPAMEALVAPYRAQFAAEMEAVIAEALVEMPVREAVLESLLGNLATDAMLAAAEAATGERLDFAVGNRGGLRVPIGPGPVTRRLVYELMPFDNHLVVLTLSGVQVDSLAQQIARRFGEPVSGITLAVTDEHRAVDVRVGGEPLDPAATYRVVTHNFLADGGDDLRVLTEALDRTDLDLLLRDVFLEQFAAMGTLAPTLEGRIRLAE